MSQPDPNAELDRIQRWMQSVITHPLGVEPGIDSPAAHQQIPVTVESVEQVINRSRALSSVERLSVYANAYYARLLECLRDSYPLLVKSIGQEAFDEFAFRYLQSYPSQSYTLNVLGARFADYLESTRPQDDHSSDLPAGWADFVIDLARFEWTVTEVFDGPGTEETGILTPEDLSQVQPAAWPEALLIPAPCLRLCQFRFPLGPYVTALRRGEQPPPPPAAESFMAVTRVDYRVQRYELDPVAYVLLAALAAGEPVGEAVARAAQRAASGDSEVASDDELAARLHDWFRTWARDGFFIAVQSAD